MTDLFRLPDLALGHLEREVLDVLWRHGPLVPAGVHERVTSGGGIALNTVSSALKRLYEKGLLSREKVSHSYVYEAAVSRSELQRRLIGAIAEQFESSGGAGMLAAFVDVAEEQGPESLRELERMIAARLHTGDK